jgi:ATP-binding cassette, subfamily G (WHITE), member 2, PDR
MHPWFKWISWINPVAYAFEGLLVNELHGRKFPCAPFSLIPSYPKLAGDAFICSVRGAVPGNTWVSGDAFVEKSYQYSHTHLWRNFGILVAFLLFFLAAYLMFTEINVYTTSTAEVLVFRQSNNKRQSSRRENSGDYSDLERLVTETTIITKSSPMDDMEIRPIPPPKKSFTWKNVTYDITIKGEPRRLLDHVSGYVRPGTLTALMGVSGAGKTTLLDALAQRTSIGVITGDMSANGQRLHPSFQRRIGYVQQQDLHLETSTVREALRFSAILRQPEGVSKTEKYQHVEEVVDMLDMADFADAVVGVPGEGLNVEQRKLLSIGVELAAKPDILIFLDEPTSGLDSQSSWAIVSLLRKLANHGQAVLATIHQPSSILFLEFDRLLFLAKGGRTVYFGNIGTNATELLAYFESRGARRCGVSENPAEYMLDIISTGTRGKSRQDWASVWKQSEQCKALMQELDSSDEMSGEAAATQVTWADVSEFAMPFHSQLWHTTLRGFQQYWRTPAYIYGKLFLGVASGLFVGFSFYHVESSIQGLQNAIFSNFLVLSIFSAMVQQIMPRFVIQRSLYEVRERPSKVYSWAAFLFSNILIEVPYQILLGIMVFVAYFYSVFGQEYWQRQGLVLLFLVEFFVFASSFAHMVIAGLPDAATAGQLATVMFSLSLIFNGVMQPPATLPRCWIFMWRVSPLTYFVQGITGTAMSGRLITCTSDELGVFNPPSNQTCGAYLSPFLSTAPGVLRNPSATANCSYCPLRSTDQFLATRDIYYKNRWRNAGLLWAYIIFNIIATAVFYFAFRVKRWSIAHLLHLPTWLMTCLRPAESVLRSLFVRNSKESEQGSEESNERLL